MNEEGNFFSPILENFTGHILRNDVTCMITGF